VTELGKANSRYIEQGTLLLTNSGATLGVPKITLIGGCINDGVAALLEVGDPLKMYLLHHLSSLTEPLRRINQGAAQPNLNTNIIREILVPLPPSSEQGRIVTEIDRRLSLVHEVESQVDANLKRTERLHMSILSRAFSGGMCHGDMSDLDEKCNVVVSSA
jgi:type I restriction enzyme S subunit